VQRYCRLARGVHVGTRLGERWEGTLPTVRCDLCDREAMFRMPRDGGYICLRCAVTILRRREEQAEPHGVRDVAASAGIERTSEHFARTWTSTKRTRQRRAGAALDVG
jgi:hypothetical protein